MLYKDKARLMVACIICAAFLLATVWITAQSAQLQYEINSLTARTQDVQREIRNLEATIETASNVNNLESRALAIGLVYPDFDEIVYIDSGTPIVRDFAMALKQASVQ